MLVFHEDIYAVVQTKARLVKLYEKEITFNSNAKHCCHVESCFLEKKQEKKFYRQPRKESVKVETLKMNQLAAQLNLDDISDIKQMMFIWELRL